MNFVNKVFFSDSRCMAEIPNDSVNLIVTSPPYFNIKDYSLDGYQQAQTADKAHGQIGDVCTYNEYIDEMMAVWRECVRVLAPNGKMAINVPLMPMLKKNMNTHHNRDIFNINSDIEKSILNIDELFLLDVFVWNRTNPTKKLMFGSYPYPRNFYAQNTIEFISVYVKDGEPIPTKISAENKEKSKLTQSEWVEYTKQVWNIPIPNKSDVAFGRHAAIMPEEIARRCIKMYTFVNDIVLDPFAGSGTTLKVAKELHRNYVGYEISANYKQVISLKINTLF